MVYKDGYIILEPNEICDYYKHCPFSNYKDKLVACWGCRQYRNWSFTCNIKRLIIENYQSNDTEQLIQQFFNKEL